VRRYLQISHCNHRLNLILNLLSFPFMSRPWSCVYNQWCFFLMLTFTFHAYIILFIYLFSYTRIWTQGLHLEPLHQPFFVMGFFQDRVSQIFCLNWLRATVLLISASWVARITGVSPPPTSPYPPMLTL
jgi:hypothetical protein